jgi:hypothetical protein
VSPLREVSFSRGYFTQYFRSFAHCLVRLRIKASMSWWICRKWSRVPMLLIARLQASSSTTATLYLTETELSWRGEVSNTRFLILKHDSTLLHTYNFTPQENYRLVQTAKLRLVFWRSLARISAWAPNILTEVFLISSRRMQTHYLNLGQNLPHNFQFPLH